MSVAIANQLFLAYLGRPADVQWRSSTANLLNGNQPSVALQTSFFNAAVAEGVYSTSDSNSTLVNKIFQQLFGFSASTFEQTAWGNLINNGTISQATAVWTIFTSYLGATNVPDAYKLPAQSKLIAVNAYTDQLVNDSASNLALSQGGGAAVVARSFTAGVNSQATAATAVTGIVATVASLSTAQTGSTFTLTTNADNFVGGGLNDQFNGVVGAGATLSAADIMNGNGGLDTLSVAATAGATSVTGGALITNVEVVNVRGAGTAGDALTLDGTGLPLQQIGLTGAFGASTFAASNVAAPVALNLTGATGLGTVAVNGTGATTVTINSTASANTTGAFTAANASTLNIAAATNLTLGGVTMLTGGTAGVVNVSGAAASVTLGVLGATVGTVTASGLTAGGITASLGSATQKVTGGAGQDIITTNGIVLGTGSVDAGAGTTDRLVVTATADLTAVTGAKYTNFEQLQANDGVTANASFLTGITDIRINDAGAATGVIGLTAAQASKVSIIAANAAGAITIGLTDSTGTADAVTAAVTNSTTAGVAQNMDLTAMSLAGIESLTLTTNGTTAANSGAVTLTTTAAVALTSISITNAGDTQLTVGATHTGASLVINNAASTGTSTVTASDYAGGTAAQAITISTGSGVDTINGSTARINNINAGGGNDVALGGTLNDSINGGAGDDALNGNGGADALTGGDGNDTFRITSRAETRGADFAAGNTSYANVDRITDFVGAGAAVGDGFLLNGAANVFGAALDFATTTVAVVTAVTVATAADFTALAAAVQTASAGVASSNAVAQIYDVTVTSGNLSGRVLILNDDTAAIAATDTFIGLTGITGALNAQDFAFT